jgi:hypothetical protein
MNWSFETDSPGSQYKIGAITSADLQQNSAHE